MALAGEKGPSYQSRILSGSMALGSGKRQGHSLLFQWELNQSMVMLIYTFTPQRSGWSRDLPLDSAPSHRSLIPSGLENYIVIFLFIVLKQLTKATQRQEGLS